MYGLLSRAISQPENLPEMIQPPVPLWLQVLRILREISGGEPLTVEKGRTLPTGPP